MCTVLADCVSLRSMYGERQQVKMNIELLPRSFGAAWLTLKSYLRLSSLLDFTQRHTGTSASKYEYEYEHVNMSQDQCFDSRSLSDHICLFCYFLFINLVSYEISREEIQGYEYPTLNLGDAAF